MIICASPNYLAQHGTPATPNDLKSHTMLGYNRTSPAANFIRPNGPEDGPGEKVISLRLPPKLVSNNGDYLCAAACDGLGIAFLPSFMVWHQIKNGQLIPILQDYQLPALSAYAIYPQTRHLSQRVRTFIDFLVAEFAGAPKWDKIIAAHSRSD